MPAWSRALPVAAAPCWSIPLRGLSGVAPSSGVPALGSFLTASPVPSGSAVVRPTSSRPTAAIATPPPATTHRMESTNDINLLKLNSLINFRIVFI